MPSLLRERHHQAGSICPMFYSILFYSILFYSILFYSILFYFTAQVYFYTEFILLFSPATDRSFIVIVF